MSVGLSWHCVEAVSGVIYVLSVSELVGVLSNGVVGIVGEEKTVPCAILLLISPLLVAVRLVVRLESCFVCDVKVVEGHHSGERTKLGSLVPRVELDVLVDSQISESNATQDASGEEMPSESLAGKVSGVNVGEIVHKSLHRNDRDATLITLSATSNENSEGSSQEASDNGIGQESELVLVLLFSSILEGPSLGTSSILSESVSHPGIALELLLEP